MILDCPICFNPFDEEHGSISRLDNKTKICSNCGLNEALSDYVSRIGS